MNGLVGLGVRGIGARKGSCNQVLEVVAAWCGDEAACSAFMNWAVEAAQDQTGQSHRQLRSWLAMCGTAHDQAERFNLDACRWWVVCETRGGVSWWRGVDRDEWLGLAKEILTTEAAPAASTPSPWSVAVPPAPSGIPAIVVTPAVAPNDQAQRVPASATALPRLERCETLVSAGRQCALPAHHRGNHEPPGEKWTFWLRDWGCEKSLAHLYELVRPGASRGVWAECNTVPTVGDWLVLEGVRYRVERMQMRQGFSTGHRLVLAVAP